jgi:tRNA (cytidine/uridine-2'-O-)-methyltransferase
VIATRDASERLRAEPLQQPFHVVLVEPEIPPNTGNIARLCAATGSDLHLVGKLGFSIDEHAVRRAGLDYWHLVSVATHVDFDAARRAIEQGHSATRSAEAPNARDPAVALTPQAGAATSLAKSRTASPRFWLFTGRATQSLYDVAFQPGDVLVFGKESVGLPQDMMEAMPESCVAIPTLGAVRSLNLANAVSIVLYEALRQANAFERTTFR